MRLRRLDLQGYKSFATRTEFVFPTGITAIVGPNGSGKSNIADAIRWALGEQSLRMLRGKTTEDMIFSGGRRRARAGMAEVLVTLDNSDGWLPIEFAEVSIGRRAYRSGDSEYLLNENRIRLRDLTTLLAESGLSQRTYAVIGQGLVDAALSLRPQERRTLFEEAAGIAVYRARREEAAGRLKETERNLERVRDILSEISPRLERLEAQAARFREHERASAHIKRLQRAWYGYHWGQAQEALRIAQERLRSLDESLVARRRESDEATAYLADLRQQQTELRSQLRDAYRLTADLHDQADAAQRELAALTERGRLLAARREEVVEESEPLLVQQEAQEERVQSSQSRLEQVRAQMVALEDSVAALERELETLRGQVEQLASNRARLVEELEPLQVQGDQVEAAAAEARAAHARLEAERDVLAQLLDEGDGFALGGRSVLAKGLRGVVGPLSELIRVPAEWEAAVEAALGSRVQALVVRDWDAMVAAREALGSGGQAVLLPLAELKVRPWQPPEGVLRAADVVTCDDRMRVAVETLLGRTLLAEDLAAARACLASLPEGGQCVTRDGEVVGADGVVTVGGAGRVLAVERASRELPERLDGSRRRRDELEAEVARNAQEVASLEAALQETDEEAAQKSARIAQVESGPLTQARTELALSRQALDGQRTLLQRELATLERLRAQVEARQERADELGAEHKAVAERLAQLREETAAFERELARVRARIGPAEEELSRLAQEQVQGETRERQSRMRVRQMEERVNGARLALVRRQDRLSRLEERIQEELGLVELEVANQITAQTPLPLRPVVSHLPVVEIMPEGLDEEIRRLKARLQRLGAVNPSAPQEYAETLERHQFLSEQVTDLQTASARLHEVIADLDNMMERAFSDSFEAIAAAFEEFFPRLFSGGSARLELTDPDDLAQTGVDIVVRPPGKRTQTLALLSGGERALTAAALIFAILRAQPTPFCVLDEVDAMLDEANIVRFRAVLEELAQETQFVVITHNRGTVEVADTVYGVSMGSDGVSQVVSLRLDGQEVGAE